MLSLRIRAKAVMNCDRAMKAWHQAMTAFIGNGQRTSTSSPSTIPIAVRGRRTAQTPGRCEDRLRPENSRVPAPPHPEGDGPSIQAPPSVPHRPNQQTNPSNELVTQHPSNMLHGFYVDNNVSNSFTFNRFRYTTERKRVTQVRGVARRVMVRIRLADHHKALAKFTLQPSATLEPKHRIIGLSPNASFHYNPAGQQPNGWRRSATRLADNMTI
jgi:hypothetical protein